MFVVPKFVHVQNLIYFDPQTLKMNGYNSFKQCFRVTFELELVKRCKELKR